LALASAIIAADHELDGAVRHGVEHIEIALARHAEGAGHALGEERIDEKAGTAAGGKGKGSIHDSGTIEAFAPVRNHPKGASAGQRMAPFLCLTAK
jgi:hypothetical protein